MSKMKVGQILGVAFSTLILLLLILGGISVSRLSELNNKVDSIANDRVPKLVMLDKWMVALLQSSRHMRNILIYDKEKIPAEIAAIRKDIEFRREGFEYFSKHATSEASQKNMKELGEIRARYVVAETELLKLAEEQNLAEVRTVLIEKTRPLLIEYIDALQKLIDYQVANANKQAKESAETYSQGLTIVVIFALIAVTIGITLAVMITGNLTRQLGGEPAYVAEVVHTIASGDLTQTINTQQGDNSSLLYAVRAMQQALKTVISQTHDAANALVSAAHSMASASHQVAEGSNQQSDAAGSMAAAVEQLTVSINMVADSARNAHSMATEAGQLSQEGAQLVQTTVGSINNIAGSVERSSREVQHLGEQSEKISGIVNVIKDIADQTNLLALNAAIEAARAGEQGRGFAVVADEVRKLAERTTVSTREIASMISEIQNGTLTAVSGMQDGCAQVREGVDMAEKSGESMRRIESGAGRLLGAVEDISSALREQGSASSQIAVNVEKIARMTEENSAAINGVSSSASELERLSQQLKANVSRFRI